MGSRLSLYLALLLTSQNWDAFWELIATQMRIRDKNAIGHGWPNLDTLRPTRQVEDQSVQSIIHLWQYYPDNVYFHAANKEVTEITQHQAEHLDSYTNYL